MVELREFRLRQLRVDGARSQVIRNQVSALNRFRKHFDLEEGADPRDLFGPEYKLKLENYITALGERGSSKNTMRDQLSYLGKWQSSYHDLIKTDGLPDDFAGALTALIEQYNDKHPDARVTGASLARSLEIGKTTVTNWRNGDFTPRLDRKGTVSAMEKLLEAPTDTLTSRLPPPYVNVVIDTKIPYRQRLKESIKTPYRLNVLPEPLEKEWREYLHYKTAALSPNNLVRNTVWRADENEVAGTSLRKGYVQLPDGRSSASGITALQKFQSVWGFMALETCDDYPHSGMGMDPQYFSMASFTDADVLIKYVDFMMGRSKGIVHQGIVQALEFIAAMIRPKHGYLRQQPHFAKRLLTPIEESEWDNWCDSNLDKITEMIRTLNSQIAGKSRSPEDPIKQILSHQHPVDAVFDMLAAMEMELPIIQARPIEYAIAKRNILLCKLLIVNPLRGKMLSIMTYRADNTGNLYQRPNGAWAIRFKAKDFKNQKGAAKKDYDVTLPDWLGSDFYDYLINYRVRLRAHDECDYVFRPRVNPGRFGLRKKGAAWIVPSIHNTIFNLSRRFISGNEGFGPHAFRHIVAHEYLKNNPKDYLVVAHILHDTIETVLSEYGHLCADHGFSHWVDYVDGRRQEHNRSNIRIAV